MQIDGGAAGWSTFGLAGLLLAWLLLKHLPAKDAQLKDKDDAQAALVSSITAKHESIVDELVTAFKQESEANKRETQAERKLCDEKFALVNSSIGALATAMGSSGSQIIAAVNEHTTQQCAAYRHDVYDKINEAVLGRELYVATKKSKEAQEPRPARPDTREL